MLSQSKHFRYLINTRHDIVKLSLCVIMADQQIPLVGSTTKPVKEASAQKEPKKPAVKGAAKKKKEGAALISIDVTKEESFPEWYQQVLTKGDMLDYYDISGCYIMKVIGAALVLAKQANIK